MRAKANLLASSAAVSAARARTAGTPHPGFSSQSGGAHRKMCMSCAAGASYRRQNGAIAEVRCCAKKLHFAAATSAPGCAPSTGSRCRAAEIQGKRKPASSHAIQGLGGVAMTRARMSTQPMWTFAPPYSRFAARGKMPIVWEGKRRKKEKEGGKGEGKGRVLGTPRASACVLERICVRGGAKSSQNG